MSRVITSISFSLQFEAFSVPPACTVAFTDISASGNETRGNVTLTDADAAAVFPGASLFAAINAVLDAKASALPDLPSIAARMTAVSALDAQQRDKVAALAALDEQLAAKTAQVATLDAALAVQAKPAP